MKKVYTVAIIGCGSRGREAYGKIFHQYPEWSIVSLCDISQEQLLRASQEFKVAKENCFLSEEEFFQEKRADVLVIATQDRDHVRMCIKALKLGYDILLEKPISDKKEELNELLKTYKQSGRKVAVCHVLRYAPAYAKIDEIIKGGTLGKITSIEAVEQVCYWHFSHSYVRGNWRNSKESSPVIMAKCCHDMDYLQHFVGARCKSVYSTGGLDYFNKQNQPEGASERCQTCKYIDSCPYSAENLYIKRWKKENCLVDCWPFNVVCRDVPNTETKLRKAYEEGPYGRCVFACDNDVCDNQQVLMEFENGVKASFSLTGFSSRMGRKIAVYGSNGYVDYDGTRDVLKYSVYGKEDIYYNTDELVKDLGVDTFGHGGGDEMMIRALYEGLSTGKMETTLEESIESHLMALAAEESRLTGEVVKIHQENG